MVNVNDVLPVQMLIALNYYYYDIKVLTRPKRCRYTTLWHFSAVN